jgi:hypothetical protein
VASALDGACQLALMLGAGAGHVARHNHATAVNELDQQLDILKDEHIKQ